MKQEQGNKKGDSMDKNMESLIETAEALAKKNGETFLVISFVSGFDAYWRIHEVSMKVIRESDLDASTASTCNFIHIAEGS